MLIAEDEDEGEWDVSAIDRPDIVMHVVLIALQGGVTGLRRSTGDHAVTAEELRRQQEWDHQNEEWTHG